MLYSQFPSPNSIHYVQSQSSLVDSVPKLWLTPHGGPFKSAQLATPLAICVPAYAMSCSVSIVTVKLDFDVVENVCITPLKQSANALELVGPPVIDRLMVI